MFKIGIGQDSHRFLKTKSDKKCIIGGAIFSEVPGFDANSDGDVIYHAICNAISSITHVLILGNIACELCLKQGITDSKIYLIEALKTLKLKQITHVAITIEGQKPKFKERLIEMRTNIANILKITVEQVGITATSGEGLTAFGLSEGVQAFAIITVKED